MTSLPRTEAMKPHVEILGFEDCPNVAPTRALVERVAGELALEPQLELIDVPDADAAARLRFLGSPSVRVNGVDVEPGADKRREHMFSCRVYHTRDGVAGKPSETWLRDALRRAAADAGN
jgi:hypothetical protein